MVKLKGKVVGVGLHALADVYSLPHQHHRFQHDFQENPFIFKVANKNGNLTVKYFITLFIQIL
jgi:hypothetical protein